LDILPELNLPNRTSIVAFADGADIFSNQSRQLSNIMSLALEAPEGFSTDDRYLPALIDCTVTNESFGDESVSIANAFLACYILPTGIQKVPCRSEFTDVVENIDLEKVGAVAQCFVPDGMNRTFAPTISLAPTNTPTVTQPSFPGMNRPTSAPTAGDETQPSLPGFNQTTSTPTTADGAQPSFPGLNPPTLAPTTADGAQPSFPGFNRTTSAPTTADGAQPSFPGLNPPTLAPTAANNTDPESGPPDRRRVKVITPISNRRTEEARANPIPEDFDPNSFNERELLQIVFCLMGVFLSPDKIEGIKRLIEIIKKGLGVLMFVLEIIENGIRLPGEFILFFFGWAEFQEGEGLVAPYKWWYCMGATGIFLLGIEILKLLSIRFIVWTKR